MACGTFPAPAAATVPRPGTRGLAAHGELQPDIVVSDIMMPHGRTRWCAASVRSGTWTPRHPAHADRHLLQFLSRAGRGADDYLLRPSTLRSWSVHPRRAHRSCTQRFYLSALMPLRAWKPH